jgi:hypothetical protein
MQQRTWGPFNGRHLTTIAVALIVGMVLVPGAVYAVDTFTNVAIQDPTSGAKTKVTNGGLLRVSASGKVTVDDAGESLSVDDGGGAMTVDGTVGITGVVEVNQSTADPLSTRETSTIYGDTISISGSNGSVVCEAINLAAGRRVRIESVAVSVFPGGTPSAWVKVWGELTDGGSGAALELPVPMSAMNGQFYGFGGIARVEMTVVGGSEFDAQGSPARMDVCGRAQASGSSTFRFMVVGTYLDA